VVGEARPVPRISAFYGIVITMYWSEHGVPHFHAEYSEHEAKVNVATGEVFVGFLPRRQARLVKTWAEMHRQELADNWTRAGAKRPLVRIDPLP
jgi:Domain of unknown function (DUF4160)